MALCPGLPRWAVGGFSVASKMVKTLSTTEVTVAEASANTKTRWTHHPAAASALQHHLSRPWNIMQQNRLLLLLLLLLLLHYFYYIYFRMVFSDMLSLKTVPAQLSIYLARCKGMDLCDTFTFWSTNRKHLNKLLPLAIWNFHASCKCSSRACVQSRWYNYESTSLTAGKIKH